MADDFTTVRGGASPPSSLWMMTAGGNVLHYWTGVRARCGKTALHMVAPDVKTKTPRCRTCCRLIGVKPGRGPFPTRRDREAEKKWIARRSADKTRWPIEDRWPIGRVASGCASHDWRRNPNFVLLSLSEAPVHEERCANCAALRFVRDGVHRLWAFRVEDWPASPAVLPDEGERVMPQE